MFNNKFLLIILVSSVILIPTVNANQPYMGAYFDSSSGITTKVIFHCTFINTDGSNFGNKWLGGVLSVAGGKSTGSPTGYVYQNLLAMYANNSVSWNPQWYDTNTPETHHLVTGIGTNTYIMYYGRIDYDSANSRILYRYWAYSTEYNIEHDIYTTLSWYHSIPSGDQNFLYGMYSLSGRPIEYLQAGAECPSNITTTTWELQDGDISAYVSSAWHYYSPGYSSRGTNALITYIGNSAWPIGGYTLNCNKLSSDLQSVTWQKSSSPQAEGTQLWPTPGGTDSETLTPFK